MGRHRGEAAWRCSAFILVVSLVVPVASGVAAVRKAYRVPQQGSHAKAAATHLVAIKGHVPAKFSPDNTLRGQFTLLVDGAVKDSGSAVVRPQEGPLRIVGGETQIPVTAIANLRGKRGALTLHFSGLSVRVDDTYGIEYGTWKLDSGSGPYAGWKGGGRWANSSTPDSSYVEWDGVITGP
jgi:hypothetical protein